ncbi:MAG: PilN domain-containing protein [Deltaproteobacteria bacterium]|nr:PilN domain-containing protein [Deltaproteobacteria bacterium]
MVDIFLKSRLKLGIYIHKTGFNAVLVKQGILNPYKLEILKVFCGDQLEEMGVSFGISLKNITTYVVIADNCLGRNHLIYPAVAKRQLDKIITFDLKEEIPHSLDQIYYGYTFRREKEKVIVIIAYVVKAFLDPILERLSRLGLRVEAVYPGFWGFYKGIKHMGLITDAGVYFYTEKQNDEDWVESVVVDENKEFRDILPIKPQFFDSIADNYSNLISIDTKMGEDIKYHDIFAIGGIVADQGEQALPLFKGLPLKKSIRIPGYVILSLILPISLSIFIFSNYHIIHNQKAILNDLGRQIQQVKNGYQSYQNLLKEKEKFSQFITLVKSYKREYRQSRLDILLELTRLLPDDAWVNYINIRNKRIDLRGEANSALKLVDILEKSPIFKNVRLNSAITKNKVTGKERFYLSLELAQ